MGARKFRRSDGILGVGFFINWGGLRQASVSWPDGPATRFTEDQFERGAIELVSEDGEQSETQEPETPAVESEASQEAAETGTETGTGETPSSEPETDVAGNTKSEAAHIRDYITANPEATNAQVIEHLATISVEVNTSQVAYQRKRLAKNNG